MAPTPPPPGTYAPPPPSTGTYVPPPPAAPAYGPPPVVPAYAPPAPPAPAGAPDPNALGAAVGRLGSSARKAAKVTAAVAGALLEDGETVEACIGGKLEGNNALLVLTDRRLLLVDDRQWKPVAERIALESALQVQGWQDDRTASLTLVNGGHQLVVDQIPDRPLAVEMAQRIRYRTGNGA